MRPVEAGLQQALDGGATTLCRCWRITRRDGGALGFTDHDEDLAFDGVVHVAATGVQGSGVETATGLAAGDMAVMGALSSDAIDARDVALGRYDGAAVALWLVDWRAVERRHLLFTGNIGRIERGDTAFTAELEGLVAPLNRTTGRAFLRVCDAAFGDARCGVDATASAYRAEAAVTATQGDRTLLVAGLDDYADGWFSRGRVAWISGANAGLVSEVRLHGSGETTTRLELWRAPAAEVAAGDRLVATAGCDKRAETCRDRFDNLRNFRGFPHLPGDDWVASYPVTGAANDGGSRQG